MVEIIERPKKLDCDIHYKVNESQNDGTKWICCVGLKDKKPFEIFIGNNDSFSIPSYAKTGEIIQDRALIGNVHCYSLRFKDRDGYNIIVEGVNRVFNRAFYNYTVAVSYMLRYMPISVVIKLVEKWSFKEEEEAYLLIFKQVLLDVLECYNYISVEEDAVVNQLADVKTSEESLMTLEETVITMEENVEKADEAIIIVQESSVITEQSMEGKADA